MKKMGLVVPSGNPLEGNMPVGELAKDFPYGARHPLVRTHPETKCNALYLHQASIQYHGFTHEDGSLYGTPEECRKLMDFLLMQHSKPEYQCRFKWQSNSIAFWDNRSCQHYASSDYMGFKRKGRRICIAGEHCHGGGPLAGAGGHKPF